MEKRKSLVSEAISFAFRLFIEHIYLFVKIFLVGIGLFVLFIGEVLVLFILWSNVFIQKFFFSHALLWWVLVFLFFLMVPFIIAIGLNLGVKKVALELHDRDESSLKTVLSCFNLIPKIFVGWLLYSLMVMVGMLFFVIPGFIILVRYAFYPYFIIDKNVGPITALKMSYEITKNHGWDIFVFWIVIELIVYIGRLSILGLFFTSPLSALAYVFCYRKLLLESNKEREFVRSDV